MKPLIPAFLLVAMSSAQAAPIAMEDQSQLKVPGGQAAPQFVPPAESELPDNALARWCARAMPCSSIPAG